MEAIFFRVFQIDQKHRSNRGGDLGLCDFSNEILKKFATFPSTFISSA